MYGEPFWVWAVWALGGVAAAVVAWRKGRGVRGIANWGFLGLAFNVIAVVVVAVLPRKDSILLHWVPVRPGAARSLVADLIAHGGSDGLHAASTIAHGLEVKAALVQLTPDQRDTVLAVLGDPPTAGLGELRAALIRDAVLRREAPTVDGYARRRSTAFPDLDGGERPPMPTRPSSTA